MRERCYRYEVFIEQLKDIERHFDNKGPLEIIQHGLLHGRSMAAMAEIECNAPIDNKLYDEINNNFPLIKEKIINDFNAKYLFMKTVSLV